MGGITQQQHPVMLNVADAGAQSKGTAYDDAPIIQSVINASPEGAAIWFPGNHGVGSTIQLLSNRSYFAPAWDGLTPTFIQQNGKNLPAVLASYEWYNNTLFSGYPVILRNVVVDANSANNTGTHGILLQNFNSLMRECVAQNTPGAGLVYSSITRNGSNIGNTAVENRLEACKTINTGSYGFWIHDAVGAVTDGYLDACIVESAGDTGMLLERAAGWFISRNHLYGCQTHGILAKKCWDTFVFANEVEGFALSVTPSFYSGIEIDLTGPRVSIVAANIVANSGETNTGTTYQYLVISGTDSLETKAIVQGNHVEGAYVQTTATTSLVSGAKTPCTPVSMDGIVAGASLFVENETVVVASTTGSTFTPTTNWVNNHGTGTYSIGSSQNASHSLGLVYAANGTQKGSGFPCTVFASGNKADNCGTPTFIDSYLTMGPIEMDGPIAVPQSATSPDPTGGALTIGTASVGMARVTPTANRSGVILQKGTAPGQRVTVVNESSSFTVQFDASGTSNVSLGTGLTIPVNGKQDFIWNSVKTLWY